MSITIAIKFEGAIARQVGANAWAPVNGASDGITTRLKAGHSVVVVPSDDARRQVVLQFLQQRIRVPAGTPCKLIVSDLPQDADVYIAPEALPFLGDWCVYGPKWLAEEVSRRKHAVAT